MSGPQLKYEGAAVTAGQFDGWVPIAAEQTASGFQVAWKMDGADQFIVWQTDGSGNWVSQGGNSTELTAFESAFAQDLDGDGGRHPGGWCGCRGQRQPPAGWMVH